MNNLNFFCGILLLAIVNVCNCKAIIKFMKAKEESSDLKTSNFLTKLDHFTPQDIRTVNFVSNTNKVGE